MPTDHCQGGVWEGWVGGEGGGGLHNPSASSEAASVSAKEHAQLSCKHSHSKADMQTKQTCSAGGSCRRRPVIMGSGHSTPGPPPAGPPRAPVHAPQEQHLEALKKIWQALCCQAVSPLCTHLRARVSSHPITCVSQLLAQCNRAWLCVAEKETSRAHELTVKHAGLVGQPKRNPVGQRGRRKRSD